jgi:4-amino-4-deoxy-L-arabinose transferase-like glycosyltransferase
MGISLSHLCAPLAESPRPSRPFLWSAAAIAGAALVVFASGVLDHSFVDEYAYISQSYYTDLLFSGRTDSEAWLERVSYDLQPLPKYLIGISLRLARQPMPRPQDAWAWYERYKEFGDRETLTIARLPTVALAASGCVAMLACGWLIADLRSGVIAAVLLMLNPLYRLHAHRAMSDVPCEALVLVALALGMWAWKRIWSGRHGVAAVLGPPLAGSAAGLALLCKFSGVLALAIVAAWAGVALVSADLPRTRKLAIGGAALVSIAVAGAVLVALNPFMTARPRTRLSEEARQLAMRNPWERFYFQVQHRMEVSDWQKQRMPHNALRSLGEKVKVFVVQGFGRFGPLGPRTSASEVRYDPRQDVGMIFWIPCVVLGWIEAIRLGRWQRRSALPPTALALVVWAALAWLVVIVYLPMAWDRYLLPIQSPNVLLAAIAMTALWNRLRPRSAAAGAGT